MHTYNSQENTHISNKLYTCVDCPKYLIFSMLFNEYWYLIRHEMSELAPLCTIKIHRLLLESDALHGNVKTTPLIKRFNASVHINTVHKNIYYDNRRFFSLPVELMIKSACCRQLTKCFHILFMWWKTHNIGIGTCTCIKKSI